MTSPNPSGVTTPPPGWYDPHNFVGQAPELQHAWVPEDSAMFAASGPLDAHVNNNTGALTAGTIYLVKIPIRRVGQVSNALWPVQTAGTGATTGTFTGLYDPNGNRLGVSADIAAVLTVAGTGGLAVCPLTNAPLIVGPPFVWAALVVNYATTQPAIFRSGGAGSVTPANFPAVPATMRYAVNGTGQTALPASIAPASNASLNSFNMFAALS